MSVRRHGRLLLGARIDRGGSVCPSTLDDSRGFTLIEVVVAVLILALAYVSVLQNFSLSLRNINRLEEKKAMLMQQQLAFEQQLQDIVNADPAEEITGELFMEGSRYRLVKITDESGELQSLVLERL